MSTAKIPTTTISSTPDPQAAAISTSPVTSLDLDADEQASLNELAKKEILALNADALEAQLEERPLAKQQELLQEAEEANETSESDKISSTPGSSENDGSLELQEVPKSTTPKPEKHARKALLKNDDTELVRVQRVSYSLAPFKYY
jgi:RNA polymerase II subunit A C-terminal domain phosphatase